MVVACPLLPSAGDAYGLHGCGPPFAAVRPAVYRGPPRGAAGPKEIAARRSSTDIRWWQSRKLWESEASTRIRTGIHRELGPGVSCHPAGPTFAGPKPSCTRKTD